ncbi:hypothetical protein [Nocardia sp. NPDC051832]|uniref:hypothetical protein n=1 Tax=Nocardia sp. NPDC051832 TaxID=3155673 RepID=UPI003446E790
MTATPTTTRAPTTSRTTTPRRTTTSAPSTLPPAADGTNVAACADGTCEVEVTGPTTIPIPGSTLAVLAITGDALTILAKSTTIRADAGDTIRVSGVVVKPVAIVGGSAVLSLTKA